MKIFDFDFSKIPLTQYTLGDDGPVARAQRAEEAEKCFEQWAVTCGYSAKRSENPTQKGFDVVVCSEFLWQVKQRTKRWSDTRKSLNTWVISNLSKANYQNGLVDGYCIFETDDSQKLRSVLLISAENVFNSELYFSKYNGCYQLSESKCRKAASSFYTSEDGIIRHELLKLEKIQPKANPLLEF